MSDSTGVLVRTRDDDLFTNPEALALTGFLAGYSGLTREAYALDLRLYAPWVTTASPTPPAERGPHTTRDQNPLREAHIPSIRGGS